MHTVEEHLHTGINKVCLTIYKLIKSCLSKGTDDGRWFLSGAEWRLTETNVFRSSGNIFTELTVMLMSNETERLPTDGM